LRVDLETNRRSIAVITAVYEAARTGRPVRL
jgi:UDP-N-acetyl-2-amino-2-deoxyglucuronate dehydrogenase